MKSWREYQSAIERADIDRWLRRRRRRRWALLGAAAALLLAVGFLLRLWVR